MPTAASLPPTDFRAALRALLSPLLDSGQGAAGRPHPAAHEGPSGFGLREHGGGERAAVEEFIARGYADNFGSRVEAFMPRLFSMVDREGRICGAFGMRSGRCRLFLERYLDLPVEAAIAARTGCRAERAGIVEIGHFSGSFPGATRTMIRLLTERLHHEGFRWVAFTGTAELRNAFVRMGLPLIDLQAADPGRLAPEERAAWGSYYEHSPRVVAGDIRLGFKALAPADPEAA